MALSSCISCEFWNGLRWLHMLLNMVLRGSKAWRTLARYQAEVQTAYVHMDLRLHNGLEYQRGSHHVLRWHHVPWWSFEEVQSWRWIFPHLQPPSLPRARDPTVVQQVQGLSLHMLILQDVAHHPTDPPGKWQHVDLSFLSHLSLPSPLQLHFPP